MLIKKGSRSSIILTPDGEFKRLPDPFPNNRPGSEVTFKPGPARYLRIGTLAAALLILLLGWQLFRAFLPQAAAYVSLDFGPSLELALNKKGEIIKVSPLNREGEELVAALTLPGNELKQGLTLILQKGLRAESSQPLLCTFTPGGVKKIPPNFQAQVMQTLNEVLGIQPHPASHRVQTVPPQIRLEAKKKGVSPGRYLLRLEAQKQGKDIPLQVLKNEKWSNLARKYRNTLNQLLLAVPPSQPANPPNSQSAQSPRNHGEKHSSSSPPGQKKDGFPKGKTPFWEDLKDGSGLGDLLEWTLTAPEEQIEEQSQEEAQEQTGNERKIKGKIPPLHKEIPRQPAQGRELAQ